MSCSSCKYLKENDKKNGEVSGCCYYCSKKECYVNGSSNKCEEFETSYGRSSYECNKIFEDGEHYYNDATPLSAYVILLIFMIIIAIIVNVFQ